MLYINDLLTVLMYDDLKARHWVNM